VNKTNISGCRAGTLIETFRTNLRGLLLCLWRLPKKEENALALLSSASHSFIVIVLNLEHTSVDTTLTMKAIQSVSHFLSGECHQFMHTIRSQ
ncbi:Putative mitogen-activated protein kinase 14C, partial [Frankliniella fusca]